MDPVLEVTDDTFAEAVLETDRPVVVGFGAPWCKPCRRVDHLLAGLAERAPHVAFARVNIDENPRSASRFQVLSIPTAILFAGGEPQSVVVGVRGRAYYERTWAAWLAPAR